MATLYVTEPDTRIEKEYRRILVTRSEEVLLEAPVWKVSEIVLVGRAGVTTPALHMLLDEGIGLSFVSRTGKMIGRLRPAEQKNISLRHAQYACANRSQFCLTLGKDIVTGKLKNSKAFLQRIARQKRNRQNAVLLVNLQNAVEKIDRASGHVALAENLDTLRGLEGTAARAYFSCFRLALADQFIFLKRSRRPPRDPTNALLSLAYTLLTNALFTACEVVGLDPYDGFFHADKYGRPALALDLVEEFRPIIADSVVLNLVNRKMIKMRDFEESGNSPEIYLTQNGLKVFLKAFSSRLESEVWHPGVARKLSYRKIFEVQARQLRKMIEGKSNRYIPFTIK